MNQVCLLTEKESREFKRLHPQTTDAKVRSRCDLNFWSDEGFAPPQIARQLNFCHYTVSRYIGHYKV